MRLLVIEDDPTTSRMLEMMFTHAGINAYCTDLGQDGIDLARLYDYDLITLDLNLPDISGFDVLRQIRSAQVETPVIVLTGSEDIESKLKAFALGADDYVTKPFHRDELIARVHVVVNRLKGRGHTIVTGKLTLDTEAKTVHVNGQQLHLTTKEYQMVELFSLRKGSTLTKEMIIQHLYGEMEQPELKIIEVDYAKFVTEPAPQPK